MQPPHCAWSAPLSGWVKINYDVSLRCDNVGVGMGCCARFADGSLLAAQVRFLDVSFSVLLVELEAIILSLTLGADFDLPRIIIESDAKGVIDYFCHEEEYLDEIDTFLNDIHSIYHGHEVCFFFPVIVIK